jgi:putative proteasome-type protease
MTYCLAMRLHEGLVFLADTRTNAGVDNIGTYRKLHVLHQAPDRIFVLESAGNLATTQEVLDRVARDLRTPGDHDSLATVQHLFEAALYVGRLNVEIAATHRPSLSAIGADGTATFILGGQIAGEPPQLFLVYPEGNYIHVSDELPFLQIGESKYGKFMLELGVRAHVDLQSAVKVALSSMLSTARANLSVGPPYEGAIYRDGAFELEAFRFRQDSDFLHQVEHVWVDYLLQAVSNLPPLPEDVFVARPSST